jgi:ADP-ribose 1''-phosphate phosphatase
MSHQSTIGHYFRGGPNQKKNNDKNNSSSNNNNKNKRRTDYKSTYDSDHPSNTKPEEQEQEEGGSSFPSTKRQKLAPPQAHSLSSSSASNNLQIVHSTGDLFTLPPRNNSLLVHACNTQGSWGAGIAKVFAREFPDAYTVYREHCRRNEGADLVGTALLIPPPASNPEENGAIDGRAACGNGSSGGSDRNNRNPRRAPRQFVGCLFTSRSFGRNVSSPDRILAATATAVRDLLRQVEEWNGAHRRGDERRDDQKQRCEDDGDDEDRRIHSVHMCKINAGLFNVPWEDTLRVLKRVRVFSEVADGDGEGDGDGGQTRRKHAIGGIRSIEVISPPAS